MAMFSVDTLDRSASFGGYLAEPDAAPRAAIIVVQEIFGVNAGIRAKCDAWAQAGYLAFAPDLFWRVRPDVQLDPDTPDELQQAFELLRQFDPDTAILDLEATIRAVRARTGGCPVGIVGFCMGGLLAYLAATRTDVDASVGYYGGGIAARLGERHAIARPLLLHFAEQDHFIGPEQREAIHAALDSNAHVIIHEYAGVDHGFATTAGKRRNDAAAELADARTAAFFEDHLR